MGFNAQDFTPLGANGPTALTPPGKEHLIKVFQIARTDTVEATKVVLPAGCTIYKVYVFGSTASDAATTASVTVNVKQAGSTISTGSVDVKANGAVTAIVQMSNLPLVQPIPQVGDTIISAVYAETGTASTTGGPWKFSVEYVQ